MAFYLVSLPAMSYKIECKGSSMLLQKKIKKIIKIGFFSFVILLHNASYAATSQYIEKITYPVFDANNPDHVQIKSNVDWGKINGSAHYYYVKPGDYRGAGRVNLSASGNSTSKRYIVLDDGRQIHPAKLSTSEQANVWLSFDGGGDYWVIDRISSLGVKTTGSRLGEIYALRNGATNNILSRLHISDFVVAILLEHGSYNNTIQNCRIADMTLAARKADKVAVGLTAGGSNASPIKVLDTKILQNEIVNINDGVQLISERGLNVHYDGTIIDRNLMWLTPDLYVNKIGGTPDRNGLYSYSENAIDIKAGSSNASKPVLITNNIMWGWRKCATDGDPGKAVTMHYDPSNIRFEDNIMFDSHQGVGVAGGGINHGTFMRNIIFECNKSVGTTNYAVYLYGNNDLKIEENVIVDIKTGFGVNLQDNSNSTFQKNVLISSGTAGLSGSIDDSDNFFYDTSSMILGTHYNNSADAKMGDLTFTYDNYTNSPKQKTIPGVVTTSKSPHVDKVSSPDSSSYVLSDDNINNVEIVLTPVMKTSGPWVMDGVKKELY